MTGEEFNNYDIVADLYDTYVPVDFDIQFFVNETRKRKGDVLELMSGTGRISMPLLEAGVCLTCVDNSAKSNVILRQKLEQKSLKVDIYDMDVRQLDLHKQFSMIIIPFSSFAHVVSREDQRQALERIYQHLIPGGVFICTLSNPSTRKQAVDGQLHLAYTYTLSGQEKLLLWILEKFDPQDDQVVQAFELFEHYNADGVMTSKRLMELHFRISEKIEFEELLTSTGFSIQAVYGDYEYHSFDEHSSPILIWITVKNE